jgi:hypothetical protein
VTAVIGIASVATMASAQSLFNDLNASDAAIQAKEAKDKPPSGGGNGEKVKIGFAIAPVTLNLAGRNKKSVGLGSYIVNAVGGCNDCHTNPSYAEGGNPYEGQPTKVNASGYLAGGQVFGPFTSANITPDSSGRPAGLTFAQFLSVMRTGQDPRAPKGDLLQVMPWPTYANMTDRDIFNIYEYLTTIPSITTADKTAAR